MGGVPSFQLAPLEAEDDLVDRLLEYNPKFRLLLEARLREGTLSVKAVRKRL